MSRVLPILFNTEMVRAILRELNPKAATRRSIKGYIPEDAVWGYTMFTPKGYISCRGTFSDGYGEKFFKLPCRPGDILYVREAFCPNYFDEIIAGYRSDGLRGNRNAYKADYHKNVVGDVVPEPKWTPSIHMPKEAARIWLKVTDVRVERLQEIKNFREEGITLSESCEECYLVCGACDPANSPTGCDNEVEIFANLWDSTLKKSDLISYGWGANPWVWVIEFERCGKPESEG